MSETFFSGAQSLRRRAFLQVAGASVATASLVLAGCTKEVVPPAAVDSNLLNLGSADVGLLNYLYLLKQLETAFYKKVVDAPPADLRPGEKAVFEDLRDHELVHRETLKYLLGTSVYDGNFIIPLPFDFSSLTLTTRAGVLAASQQFSELGAAAFAGSLRLVRAVSTIVLLAKMASAEARHAAFARDVLVPGSFADDTVVVTAGALQSVQAAKTPVQVIAETKAFFLPIVVLADSLPTA